MNKVIPPMFVDVTAHLENLHALAVEGQSADNPSDMHTVLTDHLRSGLFTLNGKIKAIAAVLERDRQ